MIILTIRTDKPEAEIGLYNDHQELTYQQWQADRQLSETLLSEIDNLIKQAKSKNSAVNDMGGVVVFQGPGSFTGLRIGLSVANALSYSLGIPIVAEREDDWIRRGQDRLLTSQNDRIALPHYGGEPHITKPKR